uniref:Molybdopterin biosynthesis protein n=1 Tax=Periphykon beckeri TaxID=2006982 RepID=A0A1Z1M381_9FLOR|nr:Molybdopterin biosynthesis protein [Periphykon beckeri]ARW60486.1 Molybdopterin biosynthesis protein [Periphykon beckeri]
MLNITKKRTIEISHQEYQYYSKQIILENIGIEGQRRLKTTKVLIIGVGGLGCPAIIYLSTCGIGCIGIVDGDQIENSNLNRQILYNISDIKNFKTTCAQKKINEINHYCNVIKHEYDLNASNSIEIIAYYDIVIDTTDNFSTRHIIDKICYKLHKTYIYGAADEFEGQIAVFNYKNGIRYKNLYQKNLSLVNGDCNRNGIMGITNGHIGTIQAIEVIKIILGLNKKCKNFLLIHNIIRMKYNKKKINLQRSNSNKINVHNLKNIIQNDQLKTFKQRLIIIDLRNKLNFNKMRIYQSVNIPLIKFKLLTTIKLIKQYLGTKTVIIYCDTLEKSTIASYYLKNNNILHYILDTSKSFNT